MVHSQHGYQINEFIESNLNTIIDMKKPTAYATLEKLSKEGYIEVRTEQDGNRPPRKIYSINEKGKTYFFNLLEENLKSAESVHFQGDVGLIFIDFLPSHEALFLLKEKVAKSEEVLRKLKKAPEHGKGMGVRIAVKHKIALIEAELSFIQETIEELEKSELQIPDE
jgi:DNA-binding PadR family transcriptional regulator